MHEDIRASGAMGLCSGLSGPGLYGFILVPQAGVDVGMEAVRMTGLRSSIRVKRDVVSGLNRTRLSRDAVTAADLASEHEAVAEPGA